MQAKSHTISLADGDVVLSTGKMAMLAQGTVFVQKGGTVLHATMTVASEDTSGDYFPLSVEYVEKMYAAGLISGSRFIKREGKPSDEATVRGRMVDHTLRPLFPKGLRREAVLVIEVMAYDGINNPEDLSVLAASTAVMMSGAPFSGPAAGVVVGVKADRTLVLNPKISDHHDMIAEYAVSGVKGRILNIEGWSKEVSEETMDAILDMAGERIDELCAQQTKFITENNLARPTIAYDTADPGKELLDQLSAKFGDQIEKALFIADKAKRDQAKSQLMPEIMAAFTTAESGYSALDVLTAVEKVEQKLLRTSVMESNKRISGREMEEIRQLSAEVDLLPTVHGSALFTRGFTQALSIVVLAPKGQAQLTDDMYGETETFFMHHYKMPGYTTGEAKRYMGSPNRREIGHGAIGQNALKHVIASVEDFPYTIRVASEIMTSNGSTSMAATCAASMALMAAGVPMKSAVAGIGVGLVTSDADQQDYKLLLDIEGTEDYYGDMDFKVTGTKDGITAIQFETKLEGVRPEILKEAFRLSKQGRTQVLEAMNSAIAKSRDELAPSAPRVVKLTVPQDMIGEIIGPGGKNIRKLVEEATAQGKGVVDISIEDDGTVLITANDKNQSDYAVSRVSALTQQPEIGTIYDGVIDKVMEYGAFVDISANISGLIHVSELSDGFVKDPSSIVKEGDHVKVKLIKIERGKQSFSIKQARETK